MGDIHAQGNPHIQLDPRNIAAVAKALSSRFATIDPANATYYQSRATDFQARWSSAMARWDRLRAPLKGAQVVVIHKDQAYLCRWLGLEQAATTEPKPVVPPSAGYLAELVLGYALAFASYLVGLAASVVTDLPSSAVIVWAMAVLGILWHLTARGNGGQLR